MAKATEIGGVECDGPVADAIPLVLRARIEEMYLLRKHAIDFSDPEGVHDMRVASRRVRSALRDFSPHLTRTKMSAPVRQLKDIADKLGVVRDYDVAISALEKIKTSTTAEVTSGLQRLIDAQNGQREPARKELIRALSLKAISQLKPAFLQALEASVLPRAHKKYKPGEKQPGVNSYKVFARSTLLKRIKELEKLSTSLYQPERVEPLHEMRIAAKRLRYALDLFAPCWGESLSVFSRNIARLQASLGELHDCDLRIDHFGKRLSRIKTGKGEQATPADERDAMIWLLSHFARLRTKHFRAALAQWHDWETKDFSNRLTATLRT